MAYIIVLGRLPDGQPSSTSKLSWDVTTRSTQPSSSSKILLADKRSHGTDVAGTHSTVFTNLARTEKQWLFSFHQVSGLSAGIESSCRSGTDLKFKVGGQLRDAGGVEVETPIASCVSFSPLERGCALRTFPRKCFIFFQLKWRALVHPVKQFCLDIETA